MTYFRIFSTNAGSIAALSLNKQQLAAEDGRAALVNAAASSDQGSVRIDDGKDFGNMLNRVPGASGSPVGI